jgi:hypothetical protein
LVMIYDERDEGDVNIKNGIEAALRAALSW